MLVTDIRRLRVLRSDFVSESAISVIAFGAVRGCDDNDVKLMCYIQVHACARQRSDHARGACDNGLMRAIEDTISTVTEVL